MQNWSPQKRCCCLQCVISSAFAFSKEQTQRKLYNADNCNRKKHNMFFCLEQSGRGAGAHRLEQKNTLFEVPCLETSFKKLKLHFSYLTFGRNILQR